MDVPMQLYGQNDKTHIRMHAYTMQLHTLMTADTSAYKDVLQLWISIYILPFLVYDGLTSSN